MTTNEPKLKKIVRRDFTDFFGSYPYFILGICLVCLVMHFITRDFNWIRSMYLTIVVTGLVLYRITVKKYVYYKEIK